ncbi:D-alanyl-D-alanine carboxypeptidase family protein [Cohnella massiliensis]|uniref:D-alanyl-D-alanine carboxypeptidase family protein n=1 Tax=Cohnella massiliensis TaxID=1816691 RepID=UPI001118509E|nr:D-alanyl-D-alanine carboxypeptidase family protein [Cohnella massiliensis]
MVVWTRTIVIFSFVLLTFTTYPIKTQAEEWKKPDIHAESAILIDAKTGSVLYSKNENQRQYPASITKIVTGIIALETTKPDEIVTVSKEARYEEGTRIYLGEGEQKPMIDLIYGLLMNSGNDAATAIAEHIDGSKAEFAKRMNRFIKERIGVENTQFQNPHGLHDPDHYTTASDMALIARYAMRNPTFREIVSTKTKPWEGEEWKSNLVNHNKLLWSYEGANGIKNGFTDQAGYTLVGSAKRGNTEIIGVLLKSKSSTEAFSDMTALLDYGFEGFETKLVMNKNETRTNASEQASSTFIANDAVWVIVRKGEEPIVSMDENGIITIESPTGGLKSTVQLSRLEQEPRPTSKATAEAETKSEPPERRSAWEIAIWITWLLMNLFLCLIATLLRRKKRRGMGLR